jgi:hypothetical protein
VILVSHSSRIDLRSVTSRRPFATANRRFREPLDHGGGITVAIGAQGAEVGVGVGEEPRRDRDGDLAGESLVAQHRLDQCAAGPTIAVGEGMNGLERCMGDGDLGELGTSARRATQMR